MVEGEKKTRMRDVMLRKWFQVHIGEDAVMGLFNAKVGRCVLSASLVVVVTKGNNTEEMMAV